MTTAATPDTPGGQSVAVTNGLTWLYHTPTEEQHSHSDGLANFMTTQLPNTLPDTAEHMFTMTLVRCTAFAQYIGSITV